MGAGLKAFKETGELLFDTENITYGLVKSGAMALIESWPRKELKSSNVDPSDGSSWVDNPTITDQLHGFTITSARSPIVFIVGKGCLNGVRKSGTSTTFFYSNASMATKYYCFDLMSNSLTGAGLKCYDTGGKLTFTSLQPPLNIIAAIVAPAPPGNNANGHKSTCYAGGTTTTISSAIRSLNAHSTIVVSAGVVGECAAHLTFSRSAGCHQFDSGGGGWVYSAIEGAGGVSGGVQFMFGVSAATTYTDFFISGHASATDYIDIPAARPTALVIQTATYPFPYG